MPWRAMDFEFETEMELEFMIYQMFNKEMLIEYIHDFILFQSKREGDIKIAAAIINIMQPRRSTTNI